MASVNCENFSSSDLRLFIESLEKISNMEKKKHKMRLQKQAQRLIETLRYLEQQYPSSCSSTLSSADHPEYEADDIEEKEIPCYFSANNSSESEDEGMESMTSDDYYQMDETEVESFVEQLCSPLENLESTKVSSTMTSECSEEESTEECSQDSGNATAEIVKKKSLKKRLITLMRQGFSKRSNNKH
ncbi:disrupted underground network [Musca autumnalis]|uniref:disrupted underground network n=1 Tax=Musca autumnalis TaxID=221902 RepID=UPI003CE73146